MSSDSLLVIIQEKDKSETKSVIRHDQPQPKFLRLFVGTCKVIFICLIFIFEILISVEKLCVFYESNSMFSHITCHVFWQFFFHGSA